MDNEISGNVPPTAPRTEGRKKIRIARIEDTRSRQVTFLKRKNGLLKKAMELGILCDCEVAVIIFNTSNGKLFEYSSVETEKVLQRYATYSGPSERRKKETFNDLSKSKGTSNIPLNETSLAQTAMHAAAAAARRPRPTYKFTEGNGGTQEYSSTGRKLSSGETPVGPFPVDATAIPNTSNLHSAYEDPMAKRQKLSHPVPATNPGLASSGVVPPIQLPDLVSGRPSFMPFTPRFSAQLQIPAITPNTASRQISNAFGLPDLTPKLSGLTPAPNYDRNPFSVPHGHESNGNEINFNHQHQHQHQTQTHSQVQEGAESAEKPGSMEFPMAVRNDIRSTMEENATKSEEMIQMEKTTQPTRSAGSSNANQEYAEAKNETPAPRAKPNLRVQIPDANRAEEFATGTPSGLNSLTTPSSGDENGGGQLQIPRLNTALTSPTGNMGWPTWNNAANGDRDAPVPLTPFLNMDTLAGPSDMGHGHLALPSPTDAGLIPLTPRGLALDSLLSNRPSTRSQELGKRPFDFSYDQNRPTDPRLPFN